MKKIILFLLPCLLIGFVGLVNLTFGYSGELEKHFDLGKKSLTKGNPSYSYEFLDFPPYDFEINVGAGERNYVLFNGTDYTYQCVFVVNAQSWGIYNSSDFDGPSLIDGIEPGQVFCSSEENIYIRNGGWDNLNFYGFRTDSLPTSSIYSCSRSLNFCESSLSTCQDDLLNCGGGDGSGVSQLFINGIEHQSAPLININIPQEFDWSYTVDENEFDLGISGYNVDTDYIDGIITTQNAKPSTEDFNKIITGLIPLFVPGLVIILFLRFVFKFIKKIF